MFRYGYCFPHQRFLCALTKTNPLPGRGVTKSAGNSKKNLDNFVRT